MKLTQPSQLWVRLWVRSLCLAAIVGFAPRVPAVETGPPRFAIGISPFLDDTAKDEAYRQIMGFLLEGLPLDSSLWLYDAYRIRTIAQITIPNIRAFESSKTRLTQFKDAIRALKEFLATRHEPPQSPGLKFDQAVRLPQFLDFIADNLSRSNRPVVAVVLGSPLYVDDKETAFAMVDGYFPSDGHLLATRDRSVFGSKGRSDVFHGLVLHQGYFGDPWTSEVQRERVTRFWTLFLQQQGGQLGTFAGDLPTVFHALRCGGADSGTSSASPGSSESDKPPSSSGSAPATIVMAATRRYEIDPSQTKVEMLRVTRDVGVTDWLTGDLPANMRQRPPSITVGPMKIGIRWQGKIDLDLYARAVAGGETLYFEHTRAPEGYYFKDHRSSPDREYEFIEFLTPVDVWKVEASVNFYEGTAPGGPEGEIRVEFDNRIYSGRFSIESAHGNHGRGGSEQGRFWTPIDLPKLLKLRQGP